jgi:GNAT superfamily N-acetyltransferase
MNGYRILPARPEHGAVLSELSRTVAYSPETADASRGFLIYQGTPEEYAALLTVCTASRVAIDADGRGAAFLLAKPGEIVRDELPFVERYRAEEYLLIDQIGVRPEARGAGLAQALLDAVVTAAARRVMGAVIMHAPVRNLRSLRFFTEKNGFSFAGSYREVEFEWGYYEKIF